MTKKLLLMLVLLSSASMVSGQTDTTGYKVLDIIYLKEGPMGKKRFNTSFCIRGEHW